MLTAKEQAVNLVNAKKTLMSTPASISAKSIFCADIDGKYTSYLQNENEKIFEIIEKSHPIMNTWLVLSSISIFFLSAFFFIIPQ